MLKSNGTDGQVVIRLFDVDCEGFDYDSFDFEKEPVFIFFDELPVPYFVDIAQERGASKILAWLTDVHSLEDAEELVGKSLYYKLPEDSADDLATDFNGWELYDSGMSTKSREQDSTMLGNGLRDKGNAVRIGTVTGLEDIPGNPCLEIGTPNGPVLVPLHEDLIVEIDEKARRLVMKIPQGLL